MVSSPAAALAICGRPTAATPSAAALYPSNSRLLIVMLVPLVGFVVFARHCQFIGPGFVGSSALPLVAFMKSPELPPAKLLREHEARGRAGAGTGPCRGA